MRDVYTQRLLDIDHARRQHRYGHAARVSQLRGTTVLLTAAYVLCRCMQWCRRGAHTPSFVVIDGVRIEVVDDGDGDSGDSDERGDWCGQACAWLLWCSVVTAAATLAYSVHSRLRSRGDASRGKSRGKARTPQRDERSHADERRATRSSIAVAPRATTVAASRRCGGGGGGNAAAAMYTQIPLQTRTAPPPRPPPARATRPADASLHSVDDLDAFLRRTHAREQQQQTRLAVDGAAATSWLSRLALPVLTSAVASVTSRYAGGGYGVRDVAAPSLLSVYYDTADDECRGADGGHTALSQRHDGEATTATATTATATPYLSEKDWHSLGVAHPAQALAHVREWVSALCRSVVDEVEQCNAWLTAQQLDAFDCSHSLRELLTVTLPPTMTATTMMQGAAPFAFMSTAATAGAALLPQQQQQQQQQTMTKREALQREKELVRAQQRTVSDFDTVLRYEQRLALEERLDLSRTFPPYAATAASANSGSGGAGSSSSSTAVVSATARQQYVLRRLRAIAKQRSFASCRCTSANSSSSSTCGVTTAASRHPYDTFPCDAHILLHILRSCVPGLEHVIRFRHQLNTSTAHDLAIVVGDTGEPYCYVRHRSHHIIRNVTPRPGGDSLFEALLAFAALVRLHYHDVYNGPYGSVDLRRTNMARFFT